MDHNQQVFIVIEAGLIKSEAHVLPYFRPYYTRYTTPRYLENLSYYKDRFDQNRSGAQPKKKMFKQIYHVKKDGQKDKSSDMNATTEKVDYIFEKSSY